jgi:hypothetical protein
LTNYIWFFGFESVLVRKLETNMSREAIMKKSHNQGAKGTPHITTHSVDVFHPFDAHLTRGEIHNLSEVEGIYSVSCDPDSGHVEVTYDLQLIHLDDIEDKLMEFGYILKRDLFHRIRNGLAHFVETNEINNMKYRPTNIGGPPSFG